MPEASSAATLGRRLSIVCMPVLMITGLPKRAMWRISGTWLHSPEPILKAGTPMSCRKSAAAREKGVEM